MSVLHNLHEFSAGKSEEKGVRYFLLYSICLALLLYLWDRRERKNEEVSIVHHSLVSLAWSTQVLQPSVHPDFGFPGE